MCRASRTHVQRERACRIDVFAVAVRDLSEYIGQTYKNRSVSKRCIDQMRKTTLDKPERATNANGAILMEEVYFKIWEFQIKDYVANLTLIFS